MSAKSGKRPLRSLSAHEKLDAIRRVHDGESKASVARDIGVPESTLRGWCKNEDKISYLSRQSSPETDESFETKHKKQKVDERTAQPYNLSLKSSGSIPPDSKTDQISGNESFKSSLQEDAIANDRERNRAELARLSVELGLNRPDIFLPSLNVSTSNLADLTTNIGLLAQWNALLMQQQQQNLQKVPKKMADISGSSINHTGLLTTVDKEKNMISITDKPSLQESVWYWLKSQQSSLGMTHPTTVSNSASISNLNNAATSSTSCFPSLTSTLSNVSPDQNIFTNNWYKQMAYQQQSLNKEDKAILYQQLTKEVQSKKSITPPKISPEPLIDQQNAENLSIYDESQKQRSKSQSRSVRSVLDNLLCNNNNNVSVTHKDDKVDESSLSQKEAVEHGEKFLKWMEACSDPSVTAIQIMQFRTLLNNIKIGADRKNGESQNKTKGKRK